MVMVLRFFACRRDLFTFRILCQNYKLRKLAGIATYELEIEEKLGLQLFKFGS